MLYCLSPTNVWRHVKISQVRDDQIKVFYMGFDKYEWIDNTSYRLKLKKPIVKNNRMITTRV